MAGKGFCVKIRVELHAITCPGVWLCPNGKVALRITSLGSTLESHRVSPIFPLLFHNEFNFQKTFTRLAALTELQRNLEQESFYAELIQWLSPCNQPILLATFETSLTDLLYPVTYCKRLLAGVDVDLLMDPSKYFPGIIAPKIEVSTKTVIEEVKAVYDASLDRAYVVNPKTIDSKRKCCAHRKRPVKGIIRQKKVCHSRAKPKVQVCEPTGYRCELCNIQQRFPYHHEPSRINQCYHPMKQRTTLETESPNRRITSVCGNLHIFDNCPVCLKYNCYFSCECDDISAERIAENPTTGLYDYDRPWCYAPLVSRESIFTPSPLPTIRHLSENKLKSRYTENGRKPNE